MNNSRSVYSSYFKDNYSLLNYTKLNSFLFSNKTQFEKNFNFFINSVYEEQETQLKKSLFEEICENNYYVKEINKDKNFGFSKSNLPYIIIPFLSILLNIIVLRIFLKNIYKIDIFKYFKPNHDSDENTKNELFLKKLTFEEQLNLNENNLKDGLVEKKVTSKRFEDLENRIRTNSRFSVKPQLKSSKSSDDSINSSSLEKMQFCLTIFELIGSIFSLYISFTFKKASTLHDKCIQCFFVSIITIFLQNTTFCFFGCILHNLSLILENPIQERSHAKRIRFYIYLSFVVAVAFTYLVIQTNIYGVSPMLTCYIKYTFNSAGTVVGFYLTLLIPFFYCFVCLYYFFTIFKKQKVLTVNEVRTSTLKLLFLALLYILFYF